MKLTIQDDPRKKTADVVLTAENSQERALLRLLRHRPLTREMSTDNNALYIEFSAI